MSAPRRWSRWNHDGFEVTSYVLRAGNCCVNEPFGPANGEGSCFWWACERCGSMSHNPWPPDCEAPCHAWWRAFLGMCRPTDVPPNTCTSDLRPGEWPRWDDRPFEEICRWSEGEWEEHADAALARARGPR